MCGCADRMRDILDHFGYTLADGLWTKEGRKTFPDARIEEDHFRVLIESMADEAMRSRAANWLRKIGG